jgi:hypothetical protein
MRLLFQRRPRAGAELRDRFLERYAGRALIVHEGFPAEWLEELLKQPGGGGYFRIDIRSLERRRPSPVEWVVAEHILPLSLPLPLFVQVRDRSLRLRHLTRGDTVVHPSEILWFLDELETRYHARLEAEGDGFAAHLGIPVADNEAVSMFGE